MSIRRASATASFTFFMAACAPTQVSKATTPSAVKAETIASTEAVAFEGEREINYAERDLEELHPDQAIIHLDAAAKALDDAKINQYPDAPALKARHRALLARIPQVREEIRKKELAAAVAQAEGKIDEARARAKDAIKQLARKAADDNDVKAADESLQMLLGAVEASSNLEDRDTAFSKYSIGARKELAGHKTAFEQRKVELAVARDREEIARVTGELATALKIIAARDVADEAIERARTSADEVQKVLVNVAGNAVKNPGLAQHVAQIKDRLATQRTWIDTRRHEVNVMRQRGRVEEARKVLTVAIDGLKARDAKFDEAEAALASVEKVVAEGAALAAKDSNYSNYTSEMKKRLAEARGRIDRRKLEVEVAQQRTTVEESRRSLNDAIAQLKRNDIGETELAAAEAAAKSVSEVLEKGTPLTAKDRVYGSYATEVAKRIEESSTRIAARRVEVAVARHKAEIALARTTLDAAMARIADQNPGEADFTAARDAVGAVEKALDAANVVKDRDLSKYLVDSWKAMSPLRSKIDQRKLDVEVAQHRVRVEQALSAVDEAVLGMAGEEEIAAADGAITSLEKIVSEGDKYLARNADYAKLAMTSIKTVAGARKQIRDRREEILMQAQKDKVENELNTVRASLEALDGDGVTAESFTAASAAIARAKKVLDDATKLEEKLPRYATYALASLKSLATAEARVAQRKLEVAVVERKGLVDVAMTGATSRVAAAKSSEATSAEVKEATAALRTAREELVKGAGLEKRSPAYETFANATRKQLDGAQEDLDAAKHNVAFREGPVAALTAGTGALESSDLKAALDHFRTCERSATSILASEPKLASALFDLGRVKAKGSTVLLSCTQQIKATEAKITAKSRTAAR